jgi:hypothetical protein
MDEFPLKGNLEVGDKVHLTIQMSDEVRKLLADLEESTVCSINGNTVVLLSKDGSIEVEMHRKYFCSAVLIGHPLSPCPFCGYEEPK